MMAPEAKAAKLFTIESANAALPLVRAITKDLVMLACELLDRDQRLSTLLEGREREAGDPYTEELAAVERDLKLDKQRLQGYVDELLELGVEPKSVTEGLVDFPAMIDGRLVYLCWKHGEEEVAYWHELDGGFACRQPLAPAAVSGSDGEEGSSQ